MKKIDIHCHTSNRKISNVIGGDATLDTLEKYAKKYDIEKTIVLATYFPHKTSGITNFRLLNWIQDRKKFDMFASLDFEHYFFQGYNEIEELSQRGEIKGIKIYTCYQDIDLCGDKFSKIAQLAKDHDLPMMFHCGFSYASMRKYGKRSVAKMVNANDIAQIAEKNPDVTFIGSHMSKPFFDDMISAVKMNLNMYTDMSGLIDSKFNRDEIPDCVENIKKFLGECGPKRLLFGTDFPVQTHEDSVYFIEESMTHYSSQDREDVYYNNSARLLK